MIAQSPESCSKSTVSPADMVYEKLESQTWKETLKNFQ